MKPSEFFRLTYLTCLRAKYPGVPEPDVLEVYRRTTHLIWSSTWDDDELAVRSYYRSCGVRTQRFEQTQNQ
jgi:hypothetical protein